MSSGHDLRLIKRQHAINGPAPAPRELSSIESTNYEARPGAMRRPGVNFFDIGLTRGRTKTYEQRRGACLQRPMLLDAARPAVCFRGDRRVTARGRRRSAAS